jgi:hypothetical protein
MHKIVPQILTLQHHNEYSQEQFCAYIWFSVVKPITDNARNEQLKDTAVCALISANSHPGI